MPFSPPPCTIHVLPSHLPWLGFPNKIWWAQILKLSLCKVFQPPVTLFLLFPSIVRSTLFLNTLILCTSFNISRVVIIKIFNTGITECHGWWLMHLLHIWEVPDLDLSLETSYPDWRFSWVSSVPPGKCFKIRPWPLPSKSIPIHHSLITLSFDAV
jgi:hypothetical protein